jgi:predicted ester cyclase
MTIQEQKDFIGKYIDIIWNQGDTSRLNEFLHSDFTDHSLPATFPRNAAGLAQWVIQTHTSFVPETSIEDQVAEDHKSMIKITMHMKHVGTWRGIAPTGLTVTTKGYRSFRLQDNLIIEHWALIDGTTLEQAILGKEHGCVR